MQLSVVGCSGSTSGPDSAASSYLVQAPYAGRTFSLLLDLGPGAFGALYRHLPPDQVDAVGLSHLHPDHCLDLCAFYVGATHSPSAPWPRIPVLGPRGTAGRIAAAYDVGPQPSGIADFFGYRDWAPRQDLGPFELRTARVAHPVEAYAVRVRETATGATITYSGDTGPTPALAELATGSDLLLIESAFLDGPDLPEQMHLSGRQAAEVARAAGVGRVVLTHVPPWYDPEVVLAQARPHVDVPVELAAPGRSWRIPGSSGGALGVVGGAG